MEEKKKDKSLYILFPITDEIRVSFYFKIYFLFQSNIRFSQFSNLSLNIFDGKPVIMKKQQWYLMKYN